MKKILIVEDNPKKLPTAKIHAEKVGEADIAEDGERAFECFLEAIDKQRPYDVIFLDIMMPKVDGKKVLQEIRRFEAKHTLQKTPIIMATSVDDTSNVLESYDLGAQHYFLKPYDRGELAELMEKLGF